jgi:hypothetical protein
VEQTIDPVADELTELCRLGQATTGSARAIIVPEQAMVAHNRGAQSGGSCPAGQSQGPGRLRAVYAADGTPVLDHPFVLLPAAAELGDRERLAHDFFAYLTSEPAQKQLREAGFRDGGRRVGGTVDLGAVRRRLDDGEEVLLLLLTFGPARCDAGALGQLAQDRDLVRCLDADRIGLERAFEQVAATLWGTGKLAAPGAGGPAP